MKIPHSAAAIGEMLRRPARGLLSAEASVEMLIGHRIWLSRADFVARYIEVETDPAHVGDAPMAFVRWKAAVGAVRAGRLVCSASEAAMLRIAASIAEGHSVDLRDALSGLDGTNLRLVLEALARLNGRPVEVAAR
ncbi:hypothetical protein GCM10022221_81820 [Actinocorallia aurea]